MRTPAVIALAVAEFISAAGTRMTMIAIPWFVLQATGSATRMGLVLAAELLGVVLFGFIGATWADRPNPRRLLIACDLLRTPLLLAIPVLFHFGALPYGMLVALVFAIGAFTLPYEAGQQVVLHEVCEGDETVLTKANGLFLGAQRAATIIGPLATAALIAAFGATTTLVVDALTYLVAAAIIVVFVQVPSSSATADAPAEAPPAEGDEEEPASARAALGFLLRSRALTIVILGFMLGETAMQVMFGSLSVLARDLGAGASFPGMVFAASGAGALLGAGLLLRWADRIAPERLIALGVLGHVLPMVALSLTLPWTVIASAMVVSGACGSLFLGPFVSMLVTRAPDHVRGAFMSTISALLLAVPALGLAVSGVLTDGVGIHAVLLGAWLLASVGGLAIAAAVGTWAAEHVEVEQAPAAQAATVDAPELPRHVLDLVARAEAALALTAPGLGVTPFEARAEAAAALAAVRAALAHHQAGGTDRADTFEAEAA